MLSLFGSLLGFGTSFLPNVLDFFAKRQQAAADLAQDKQDKAHELAMQDKIVEGQKAAGNIRLEATMVESNTAEVIAAHEEQAETLKRASVFIVNLSASIRPVVTYLFVVEFLALTAAIAWLSMKDTGITVQGLQNILDPEFKAMLATMLSFWFGNRTFGKRKS